MRRKLIACHFSLIATIALLLLTACNNRQPHYVIGVSQCSDDIWREKQNTELRMDAYFHKNAELRFAAAYDSDERQIQQIDSLLAIGIDLLIVAPNQVATVSPAIDRAYDQGIPVIVFERKTNSEKYTAFIGADNYQMGRQMGEYIASRIKGKGRVMEVMGLKGSSPAIERHHGFADALEAYPDIQIVTTLQGDWTEQSAYDAVKAYKGDLSDIDYVFGQNDRMALGARKALMEKIRTSASSPMGRAGDEAPQFCGIDGLPGENGGIQLVRDSILAATILYPTRGDLLLDLALDILDGKPYPKETRLTASLVTPNIAQVLLSQSDEITRQSNNVDKLHALSDNYLHQLDTQRMVNIMAIILVVLLMGLAIILYRYHLQKIRLQEERTRMEREQLNFYTQVSHELRTPLTLIEGPLAQLAETSEVKEAGAETLGLFAILRRNTHQLTDLINKMLDVQASGQTENSEWKTENSELRTERYDYIQDRKQAVPQDPGVPGDHTSQFSPLSSHTSQFSPLSSHTSQFSVLSSQFENATVLIVDDNADIRAYLRTILQDRYQVNEAADGQQGLALANEIVPDLIVSDVMMPVMNGLEFCQRVKSGTATSHIPVILLTARALSQHQIEGYESGADAYITKPFSADVLLARISNLLKSRHQLKNLFGGERSAVLRPDGSSRPEVGLSLGSSKNADDGDHVPAPATPQVDSLTSNLSPLTSNHSPLTSREDSFLLKFRDFVEKNLADSELSVETIGAELGLSRVQLYRKVKALTGQSPVELLRTARLQKGRELLQTTDKNVSEVAYEVGFTAPSYFTKCFKDEFGVSPSDLG